MAVADQMAIPPTAAGKQVDEHAGAKASSTDAVVIGAGFAGLYAIHRLRDVLGLDVRAIEAGDTVGGTWYWNRYPGARSDSDGYVYCYSFSPELCQDWQWRGKYPEQAELLSYLNHVADRFDLRRSIDFDTYVQKVVFDDAEQVWRVTTDQNETITARYVISGVGSLSIAPYTPDFPGIGTFEGSVYHSAKYPADAVDLKGKRVGVIGTGSSGVQMIPVIAQTAEHLTVFQRTPQYSIPARHETATAEYWREIKANYPQIFEQARHTASGFPWQHNGKHAMEVSEKERLETYEALWQEGGIKFALGSFQDISYDLKANASVSEFMHNKMRDIVHDPKTAEMLVPDHPFWSRRPIVDTNYFETYNRDNVTLLDVKANPIVEFTPKGVRTTAGEVELDVVILATGFDAITGPYLNIDIRGRDGITLAERWKQGAITYLGLQVSDFPNFFMITGPGSTAGNLTLTIETHVDWIADCIEYMHREGIQTIEPHPSSEQRWADYVQRKAANSLLSHSDSWINGSNVPGKVRSFVLYLGHFGRYRQTLIDVAAAGYDGFVLDGRLGEQALAAGDTDSSLTLC